MRPSAAAAAAAARDLGFPKWGPEEQPAVSPAAQRSPCPRQAAKTPTAEVKRAARAISQTLAADDGLGPVLSAEFHQTLQNEVRAAAYQIFRESGSDDELLNWRKAEERIVGSILLQSSSFQWLRRDLHVLVGACGYKLQDCVEDIQSECARWKRNYHDLYDRFKNLLMQFEEEKLSRRRLQEESSGMRRRLWRMEQHQKIGVLLPEPFDTMSEGVAEQAVGPAMTRRPSSFLPEEIEEEDLPEGEPAQPEPLAPPLASLASETPGKSPSNMKVEASFAGTVEETTSGGSAAQVSDGQPHSSSHEHGGCGGGDQCAFASLAEPHKDASGAPASLGSSPCASTSCSESGSPANTTASVLSAGTPAATTTGAVEEDEGTMERKQSEALPQEPRILEFLYARDSREAVLMARLKQARLDNDNRKKSVKRTPMA